MNKNLGIFSVVSISLFFSVSAAAEIDAMKMLQQVHPARYMKMIDRSEQDKLNELNEYQKIINDEIASNPNNPNLYWLRGLHAWSVLYAWDSPVPIEKNRHQKKLATLNFRKVFELDDSENTKLNLDVLYSLKTYGSSDVHVEAGRRILASDPYLEERKELDIRGGMSVHYTRLGEYEKALAVYDEFEEKYPGKFVSEIKTMRNHTQIDIDEAQKKELAKKEAAEKQKLVKEPKQSVTQSEPKPEPVTQPVNPAMDSDASKAFEDKKLILISALVIVGLFVMVYIFRRSRKK